MLRDALIAVALSLAAITPAFGQATEDDYPVLAAAPDANGVDLTTRAMVVDSPLKVAAPGASHLGVDVAFKGAHLSASINYYITDNTITSYGGNTEYRYVNVSMGYVDRMFYCAGNGVCTNLVNVDGSKLERFSGNIYKLTDGDGTQVDFFSPIIQYITPCDPEGGEIDCSSYSAYAHASSIKFANGEKLTFSPLATFFTKNGVQQAKVTVTSNLGYSVAISYPYSSTTQNPGGHWTRAIAGDDDVIRYELYKGSTRIEGIEVSKSRTNNYLTQANVVDDLSRTYSVHFENRAIQTGCGAIYTLPDTITSPGGVQKSMYYPAIPLRLGSVGPDSWPVGTVTIGQNTWTYSLETVSGDTRVTVTDPLGSIRRASSEQFFSPLPNYSTCGGSGMGGTITRDEIGATSSAAGKVWTYDYNGDRQLILANRPEMDGFSYARDARSNVTGVTALKKPSASGTSFAAYSASYVTSCTNPVTCNKPAWKEDANGGVTDYTYDATHGGVLTETLPQDSSGKRVRTTYTYASYNTGDGTIYRVSQATTCYIVSSACSGVTKTTAYTYWGATFLPATVTESASDTTAVRVTGYSYDDAGRPVQITDPNGGVTLRRYDAAGRLTGEISPSTGVTLRLARQLTYNNDDQVLTEEWGTTSGTNWTSFSANRSLVHSYNTIGQKTKTIEKDGSGVARKVTQFSYDAVGRPLCTAVRMNSAQWNSQTNVCVPQATGSAGPDRVTKNIYNSAGELVQVWRAVGTAQEQAYTTTSYTPNGKPAYVVDANGNRAKLEYDGFDRQVKWIFPSTTRPTSFNPGSAANATATTAATAVSTAGAINTGDYEQYGYDLNGNRTSLRKRDGQQIAYQYDALNHMTLKNLPTPSWLALQHRYDVYYSYNFQGLQTDARFGSASGEGITNTYDGLGRLTSSRSNLDGLDKTLTYEYDLNGNRTKITHPDAQYFRTDYDGLNRPTALREGATVLGSIAYNSQGLPSERSWTLAAASANKTTWGYDTVGQLSSLTVDLDGTSADVAWSFTRNPASQILTETRSNDDYAWDGAANLTRSYTTNGLNQYTAAGPASFCYDANGNLTADGHYVYLYDLENRLVEMRAQSNTTCSSLSYTGALEAELRYDPMGRLYSVNGTDGTVRYLYDDDARVAEFSSDNTLLRRYVHGPDAGADDPLVWYEGGTVDSATRRYLHSDARGSIITATDYSGDALFANTYDEYGIKGSGNQGAFQYTGQAWLPDVGMYYYKARMYSPLLGRFMQTDPVGYDDQINLYAYVGNDPVNGRDPTGTTCTKVEHTLMCMVEIKGSGKDGSITKQDRADAQKLANNYLKAAKKADAAARAGQTVTVKPMAGTDLKPFVVSAKEIRDNLFKRTYTYNRNAKGGDAGMATGSRGAMTAESWIYGGAAGQPNRWQQEAFIHEAIHGSYSEGRGMEEYATRLGIRPWSVRHQEPYNDAADQVLGY